jgi:phosphatidylglycerophosphatase A
MEKSKIPRWKIIIGSFFFLGKIRGGGTWSSIVTGIILFFLLDWSSPYFVLIGFGVLVLSILLSLGIKDDPSWFTLDEVTGTIITFAFHSKDVSILIVGLILFRLFDIFKLPLIKKVEKVKTGMVLDDILAGILASVFLFILHSIKYF